MPTTYTHHAYGRDVFKLLPKKLRRELLPYIDYYNIGVHGPDILFYYHCYQKNAVNQCGVQTHDEPAGVFFTHAFQVFEGQKRKRAAAAYLAGFMTHFILDSSCHPYIRRRIEETGVSHEEIEADWDSQMLKANGKNLKRFKRAGYVRSDMRVAKVIAPYFDKTPAQIRTTLTDMKIVVNYVLRSGTSLRLRRWTAMAVNYSLVPRMNLHKYFVKEKINPANEETCRELWKIYHGTQKECAHMIVRLYKALLHSDIDFCRDKRLKRVFS